MSGLRGFLIGIANFLLVAMVVLLPAAAFAIGALAAAAHQPDPALNVLAGSLAALLAFVVALPFAALVALFLDIREQLVRLNGLVAGASRRLGPPTDAAGGDPRGAWTGPTGGRREPTV